MEIINPQQLADEGQAEYNKGEYQSAAQYYKAAADGHLSAGGGFLGPGMRKHLGVVSV